MMQSQTLRIRFLLPLLVVLLAAVGLTSCSTQYADNGDEGYADEPYDTYTDDEADYDASPRADWGMFSDLDFYGQWFWVDPYGWTWRPTVIQDWRPFFHGHWIWTTYGWTWVSYEPFGWATYHYGWWAWEFGLGWIWIPDYDWYPARVDWLIYGDYVCWAPMPYPDHYWNDPWIDSDYPVWCVIDSRYFVQDDVGRYHTPARFKSRYSALRHQAPERRTIERKLTSAIQPVPIQFEAQHFGGRDFRRMVLPPEERERVEQREAQEKQSFKRAYRDRYGIDPGQQVGSTRTWTRDDNPPPVEREPKTKTKTKTRENPKKPEPQVDNDQGGDTQQKEKEKQQQQPKTKEKQSKQKQGKEKNRDKGGGKGKG